MDILSQCRELFVGARKRVADAMPLLWEIADKNLWADKYSNFSEYLDDCQISRSFASRLLKVNQHYAIEGGVSHAKLAEIDPDRLYLAISLKGNAEEQFAKAANLSRGELKEQAVFEETGKEHDCIEVKICKTCGKRM